MKKLVALSLMLFIAIRIFAQDNPIYIPGTSPQDYEKKSRNQKRTAWILLGTGILAVSLAAIEVNPDYGETTHRTPLVIGGLIFIGASIPCFIAAKRNKKKAAAISFRNKFVPRMSNGGLVNRPVPSLHFEISL